MLIALQEGGCQVLSIVRTMKPGDVPSVMDLSSAANWNQTPDDWLRILQLSPQGCRLIEDAGRIAATVSLLSYGTRLAWIGMVLTRLEYRRQGLAMRLMEDAIANAERDGIRTLKLDATDQGRPLYESLGFVMEAAVERWERGTGEFAATRELSSSGEDAGQGSSHAARIPSSLFSLDEQAFGASRKTLLESLSASGICTATAEGYLLTRPGKTAQYLGPCVATSEAKARQLIAARIEDSVGAGKEHEVPQSRTWYWDLLPANPGAVRCATELGFKRRRILWRMRRGDAIENNDALVYAIAGFELG
jgi:N-acetylglutamate synthase-like GNAT family acetyltransferase